MEVSPHICLKNNLLTFCGQAVFSTWCSELPATSFALLSCLTQINLSLICLFGLTLKVGSFERQFISNEILTYNDIHYTSNITGSCASRYHIRRWYMGICVIYRSGFEIEFSFWKKSISIIIISTLTFVFKGILWSFAQIKTHCERWDWHSCTSCVNSTHRNYF